MQFKSRNLLSTSNKKETSRFYELEKEALINLHLTKIQVEIGGFFIFLISYLLFFNLLFHFPGSENPIYAPGTLIFALLGYRLGGYIYEKYLK